jgi:hypothetical protein
MCSKLLLRLFRKRHSDDSAPADSSGNSEGAVLKQCDSIINSSLLRLTDSDAGGASGDYHKAKANTNRLRTIATSLPNNAYLGHLVSATEAITEICRDIAFSYHIPSWQRHELELLRNRISGGNIHCAEQRTGLKDIVIDAVSEHSSMPDNCWDDRSGSYQYLRLLQNIYTAVICRDKIMFSNQTGS